MSEIADQERRIRDFINNPRIQYKLLANSYEWNIICSCLDVLGDTELAIESYLSSSFGIGDGQNYIIVYGILQILFVQQDAIINIAAAFGVNFNYSEDVKFIREIRNNSIGHPTKREKLRVANFISRYTLSKHGFQLMVAHADKSHQFISVNIPHLIETQRKEVVLILNRIIDRIREDDMTHRKQHFKTKLVELLPSTIFYHLGKMAEAAHSPSGIIELGRISLLSVQDMLADFSKEMSERGILSAYDSVTYILDELKYPVDELHQYFDRAVGAKLNDKDAYIFCSFVTEHIKSLREIASELDNEYNENLSDEPDEVILDS